MHQCEWKLPLQLSFLKGLFLYGQKSIEISSFDSHRINKVIQVLNVINDRTFSALIK